MVISSCFSYCPDHKFNVVALVVCFPRCLQALASNAPDMGLSPDVARVGHWLG